MESDSPACGLSILAGSRGASPKVSRAASSATRFLVFTTSLLSAFGATLGKRATAAASAADFQSDDANVKPLPSRDFRLKAFEQRACELLDSPALEARQVHMIDGGFRLVIMLLAVQVHEIQLVDQAQLL